MARVVACPTPELHCSGGTMARNAGIRYEKIKFHQSHPESFRCYVRYLIRVKGYTRIPYMARCFRPPDGGPVMMLTKKSKFGAAMRTGKKGEGGTTKASRWMPYTKGRSGLIISN